MTNLCKDTETVKAGKVGWGLKALFGAPVVSEGSIYKDQSTECSREGVVA